MYGIDKLKTITYIPALFCETGPSIGNTYSAQVRMEIFESNVNWPRMGKFDLKVRLVSEDGTQQSEWLTLGTFFTDERYYDNDEYLSIVAYDGMLMTEQSWTDKIDPPANWPITTKAWCTLIQDANLFNFTGLANLDDTVPLVGLDTTSTIRDVLKTVAAANGGNWVMDGEDTLRLIPFANGNTSDFVVGHGAADFNKSDAFQPITKVVLTTDDGVTSESGTDTGYTLKATCNFASAVGVADLALSNLQGYVYKPFDATTVFLDPAVEPGDLVEIEEEIFQVMELTWDINTWPSADLSAPFEEEIDHEFTYESEPAKYYKKSVEHTAEVLEDYYTKSETESYIQQNAESIVLGVTETYYYDKTDIDLQNRQLSGDITVEHDRISAALTEINTVDGEVDEIQSYIRYEMIEGVGTVVIGQTDSLSEFRISNEQIAAVYNNEIVSYWNQNKQYTPKQLQIPLGGSLRLGNILFQPRTSGNLSIFLTNS